MSREVVAEIVRLRGQYDQINAALQALTEEQQGAAPMLMLQMVMTRVAMVDAKIDLLAARVMPDVARPNGPRIVMPGRQ